jgi:PAS domain S-box-containing protein
LLLKKEIGTLQEVVSKTRMEDKDGIFSKINYSRTVVNRTVKEGKPVMMSDTSRADKADLSDSMERMNVRSVMCVPLNYKGDIRGVIYVDSIGLPEGFRKDDLQVLTGLSNTAAIAIENARLYEEVKQELAERKRAQEALQKVRNELEEQVEKRTAELSKTIELLRQEIAERKRAEEALRESEDKYRTILESIEDGYFEVDIRGNFTFFNDSMCKILGYPSDELIGMNNREYMDQENAKNLYQTFNTTYTTGEPTKGFDYEIIRKDGAKGYVGSSASLIKDAEGQPIGFRGIMRDVTARKQMEMELIQTKNFLQSILDSSIDGITTTDLQGNVIYASPRTKDILGCEQEATIGKKVYSLYGNGIEDAKAIMKELREKGELRDHEMKLIIKDGELIDINLSASLLKDEKGEVIGTLGIYRDITEKNRLEAQLAQAQRMEAIGTLAGGMAHNFNNLLMTIQGNASIMLSDVDSTHPHYERLKSIEKGVQRGSRLTRQLLGYSRGGKYEPRPISLNQLVKETSNTFGETRKEVVLHRELAQDLWGIKADQSQIEQSLLNMYVNAAEAMADGGDLFLKTTNVTHKDMKGKSYKAKPGNYVLLTVRDTGVGMDKKTIDRIFDPFFTTKGLARSTGLGLASVYGIVKAHGGYIDVESKRGQGTTFEIYLPATQKEVKEEKKFSGELVNGKGTILLVDDEETVIDVGEQMLKKLGYEVYLAKGGQEAIDVYKENKDRIDMVLLDIVMPGMSGGRTYDSLTEIDSDIKVLLSSGYDIEGKAKEILERGCDAFIQKPFNMRELSQELRKILDS